MKFTDFDESTPLADFVGGLQTAGARVVQCESGDPDRATWCSGWLITDSLVAIPAYAADYGPQGSRWQVTDSGNSTPRRATVVYRSSDPKGYGPALLRLEAPSSAREPLRFSMTAVRPGQRIAVLFHTGSGSELRLSFGSVLDQDDAQIFHDAATTAGSGGAPVLDLQSMQVVGMHVASIHGAGRNMAWSTSAILASCQESEVWVEVAAAHGLANLAAVRLTPPEGAEPVSDDDLILAALRWSIRPEEVSAEAALRLRTMVVDPGATEWHLTGESRRQLLASAGSIDRLRRIRGDVPAEYAGQRAIDRALVGPPFALADVDDDELPYWLQVTRWFADVVDGLPTAADVARELSRRRLRSPLRRMAGPHFSGRTRELDLLSRWYQDDASGVMALHGIGGMGKSALIAQFALELPDDATLFWLDFDRADLAPDDRDSVVAILADQAATQLDGIELPAPTEDSWLGIIERLAAALTVRGSASNPLIVLDGFEIAQHAERYAEIWTVLDELAQRMPDLKVLVSGRAPIRNLVLNGRPSTSIELVGLPEADSRGLLRSGGLDDAALVGTVLEVARGIPLILLLALRLWRSGGDPHLPEHLPAALIDGYLYDRILDRVVDAELQSLARDVIVLRYVTADMLGSVFAGSIPAGSDAPGVYARLSRELSLVDELESATVAESPQPLRLRPELRAATLRLLESLDRERVADIDRRAVAWYAAQDLQDPALRAELVYHCLRLGELDSAEVFWRDELAPLLMHADEEIPEPYDAARYWLRDRLQNLGALYVQTDWEADAYQRIRKALARGLISVIKDTLAEWPERVVASRLIVYDAWLFWRDGNPTAAMDLLSSLDPHSPAGRDCAVLMARITCAESPASADAALEAVDTEPAWSDWEDARLAALAVRSARIRLSSRLDAEYVALRAIRATPGEIAIVSGIGNFAMASDVLVPWLAEQFDGGRQTFSARRVLAAPRSERDRREFRAGVDRARSAELDRPIPLNLRLSELDGTRLPWRGEQFIVDDLPPASRERAPQAFAAGRRFGADLAVQSVRRWFIASEGTFLSDVGELAIQPNPISDPLASAVVGTLGALCGFSVECVDRHKVPSGTVIEVLDRVVGQGLPLVAPEMAWQEQLAAVVNDFALSGRVNTKLMQIANEVAFGDTSKSIPPLPTPPLLTSLPPLRGKVQSTADAVIVYLLSPDPLEMLLRRVLGLPIA